MRRFWRTWRILGVGASPWTRTSVRQRVSYATRQPGPDQEGITTINMVQNAALLLAFGCGLSLTSSALLEMKPAPTESKPINDEIGSNEKALDKESIMHHAKSGIQARLAAFNLSESAVPPFTISAKGQQVSIKFPVSPLCDLWSLVVSLVARVGKLENIGNGGKLNVSASDSFVAQALALERPSCQIEQHLSEEKRQEDVSNDLCIGIFDPMIGEKFPEIEFLKRGSYSEEELDIVVNILRLSNGENERKSVRQNYKKQHESRKLSGKKKGLLDSLEEMGVRVYAQDDLAGQSDLPWDILAGYDEQKREIEDTVLLALKCPEVYDSIARGTRRKFESNRPRAILFEGPPGTGKTSSARVIATKAAVPLLYVPIEAVMSKYYGQSERSLSKVFDTANDLENGAIIFLDEIDSLAINRDAEMHEATRRMLSVLLRQIDGFENEKRVVVIAATNRKEDLDPALISRFDSSIYFGLPDKQTREDIAAQYARHLTPNDLRAIAAATEGMSGRDLRDICQQAERRWASKAIRNHAANLTECGLPPLEEYIECAQKRKTAILVEPSKRGRHSDRGASWPPSVVV